MPAFPVLTTQGDLLTVGIAGIETRLPGNASENRKFLRSVGDGENAMSPSWDAIEIADVDGLTTALNGKAASAHTHAQGDIAGLSSALADKADLVGGKLVTSQIPALAISEFLGAVDDETEMLDLVGQRGDYCYRNDLQAALWLTDDDPTDAGHWLQVAIPSVSVQSVNSQTGAVVLGASDVGAAAASHTHTISNITGLQTAIDGKANLSGNNTLTGIQTINGGYIDIRRASLVNGVLTGRVTGDSGARWNIYASGLFEISDGSNAADVRLSRFSAGVWRMDSAIVSHVHLNLTGGLMPGSMADSAAPNNSIYFSTTQSKLVYKDSGGVVNALY